MGGNEAWLVVLHLFQQGDGFLLPACAEKNGTFVGQHGLGSRIQRLGAFDLRQGLGVTVHAHEVRRIPMMRRGIVGVELNRPAEFPVRRRRIPHPVEGNKSQGCVRFRRLIIKFDGFLRRCKCPRVRFR